MMDLIALCIPWALLILCMIALGLLIFRKWKWSAGALLVGLILNTYFECFQLIPHRGNEDGSCLRVMSFNCNLLPVDSDYYQRLDKIAELIEQEDADVVFLTENFYSSYDTLRRAISELYPYYFNDGNGDGNAIYSKYMIVRDSMMTGGEAPHAITYVQILYGDNPIDIFGCHLASNNFDANHKFMPPDSVESSQQSKAYLRNVMDASRYREDEARELVNMLTDSDYPSIVMGDMNDVAGSPAMRVLAKAQFKDAWWQQGFGYGATIHKPLPYRIDHVLYREGIECRESRECKEGETVVKNGLRLKSIKKVDASSLSDHDALVAEFSLEN